MGALIVARRELAGYFATPVAYVFIVIFLMMAGALTFTLGGFFARGQAELGPFFTFVPWLFLFLVPALTMRLWAEERRLGTIELLLTLPLPQWQAVVGKFLAAWAFCAIALALTFPLVLTVNYLGNPDNGVILAGCFVFAAAGSPVVTEFLSQRMPVLAEIARAVSITERFNSLTRGVIALRDVVFFASFMGFFLFVNAVVIDHRKAD